MMTTEAPQTNNNYIHVLRMLILMFGASLLISIVSIVHVVFYVKAIPNVVRITGALEVYTVQFGY